MRSRRRKSFTLIELLVAIAIVAVLAAFTLVALYGASQMARMSRTRTQISRLNELMMTKWEQYRTRPLPVRFNPATSPANTALYKLQVLRELMRLELPDRWTDLYVNDGDPFQYIFHWPGSRHLRGKEPPAYHAYRRRVWASGGPTRWTRRFQGAECLYMIVAEMREGGVNGLDYFRQNEIGDIDRDGMKELLDGWGNPIEFLRWAPGFADQNATFNQSEIQRRDPFTHYPGPDLTWNTQDDIKQLTNVDPFDPMRVDLSDEAGTPVLQTRHFGLFPLIFSAGKDQIYDITTDYAEISPGGWVTLSPDTLFPGDPGNTAFSITTGPLFYALPPLAPTAINCVNLTDTDDPYLWIACNAWLGRNEVATISEVIPVGTTFAWQLGKFHQFYSDSTGTPIPLGGFTDNIHNHLLEDN